MIHVDFSRRVGTQLPVPSWSGWFRIKSHSRPPQRRNVILNKITPEKMLNSSRVSPLIRII